jgi:hypothetical protein
VRTRSLLWLAPVLLLSGCVPSIHPFYTEKDLVFEPALVGTWVPSDSKDTWTFEKEGDKAYQVTVLEEGKPGKFQGHLLKLGDHLFLDLFPKPMEEKQCENISAFWAFHFVPAHTCSRLQIKGDSLEIAFMDPDALDQKIKQGETQIGHERIEDTTVLTAPTQDLQALVLKYAEGTQLFGEPGHLQRQK